MTRCRGHSDRDIRRRTLSQNFLRDTSAASRFLDTLDLDPDLLCLEVGAGDGALTEGLAARCARLVAYEMDARVAEKLQARLGRSDTIELVIGDFIAATPPDEPFQVAGNAPFSLTSAVVEWCLNAPEMITATIITQLEYARKRTGDYGRWSRLTILSWAEYAWEMRGRIPRDKFRPVPRVDAGVLHLAHRATPLIPPDRLPAYYRLVRVGFEGRGGTLYASLTRDYPATWVRDAFRETNLSRDTVVAFVAPEQWLSLFAVLDRHEPRHGLASRKRRGPATTRRGSG